MPMEKLRSSSRRGLRNGSGTVRQCTTKIHSASAPMKANRIISVDSNQSSRWPRSRINWAAVIATDSAKKPIQSNFTGVARRVVAQREPDADQRADAGRDDHEEGGAPVVGFRRDAAQDGAEHGTEHRADAPHHQGGGLEMLGKGRQQDGLAHRHDRRAERALRDAGKDQGLQAVGEAAQQRGDGEAEHGEEHQVAPAQPARQPARHRRGDGGGDQVERDHPGDLFLRRRQVAAHLRQHQVGQGDGHAEQHVGELDHQQDEPLPPADREEAAFRLSDGSHLETSS